MQTVSVKRQCLRELVFDKNRWSRSLTDQEKALGFLGWHERGYLPHCDFPDLIQFITIRLFDSMPSSRRGEWEHLLKIEQVRERRLKLEEYLDRGAGGCALRSPEVAELAENSLLHFHNERYELLAWCVMPNHVHILFNVWQFPMWKVVRSWKHYVQTQVGRISERRLPARREGNGKDLPCRRPAFQLKWQREYWDTFMRSEEQERKAIRYIENNPVKARLCKTPGEWLFSSARFRDKFNRLAIP